MGARCEVRRPRRLCRDNAGARRRRRMPRSRGVEEGEAGVGYIRDFHTPDLSWCHPQGGNEHPNREHTFQSIRLPRRFQAPASEGTQVPGSLAGAISRNRRTLRPPGSLGLAGVEARNAPGDLGLPGCFGSRLRFQIHAVEETAGEKKTLIPAAGQAPLLTKRRVSWHANDNSPPAIIVESAGAIPGCPGASTRRWPR